MPVNTQNILKTVCDSFDYLDGKNWTHSQKMLDRSRMFGMIADGWALKSDWVRYSWYAWTGFYNYVREQDPKLFADISAGQFNSISKTVPTGNG